MLHWALFLFLASIIAAFNDMHGLAKALEGLSLYMVVVFAGLFAFSFVLDRVYRASRRN